MNTNVIESGQRIGNETSTVIPEGATIRPLRDQIIFEPIDWPFSDTLKVVYTGRPLRGIVKAIGRGIYPKRYNGPKGVRTKSWDSKAFRPCDVKVGDVIQIGGLGIGGYLNTSFIWGTKTHYICSERDVTGIES
jgi:hypothetical protein